MKAIHVTAFGDPEVLQLHTVPDPVPTAGQVLVRIRAAGVNPFETYIRSGNYAQLPELPYTPGRDGAGTVESVGSGVTHVQSGDRVYLTDSTTGTYAELALANANDVHPLPDNASFAQGAALGVPCSTAWRALFLRARAQADETVLVHGATGGVGLAATQLARAAGLRVLGTGGTEQGRQLVAAQGAAHVLDHHAEDYAGQIMDLTGGRGVDVIIEMLANVNLARDLTLLAPGGRVAIVGNRGTVEINPRDAMAREAAILGVMLWHTTPEENRGIQMALQAGLQTGALAPVIGHELPLADAARAHEQILRPGALGKVVLVP